MGKKKLKPLSEIHGQNNQAHGNFAGMPQLCHNTFPMSTGACLHQNYVQFLLARRTPAIPA